MNNNFKYEDMFNANDKVVELGCNVVMCSSSNGGWLKNTQTGAIRQMTQGDYVYGFDDSDFNWAMIGC